MTRAEAVTALARLSKDREFLQKFADGDITAVNAQREIAKALVGDDPINFQRGQLTAEEMKVTGNE